MKHTHRFIKGPASAVALVLSQGLAMAQTQDAASMLNTIATTLKSLAAPAINVVSIIVGLVGLVQIVPTFAKYAKGEPTSAEAFIRHGGGLLIAVVIIQIIRIVLF